MVKVTYSLDKTAVRQIRRTADRLGMSRAHVVREAIADDCERKDRLSERERIRLLSVIDRLRDAPVTRSEQSVDAEIRAVRAARRTAADEPGRRLVLEVARSILSTVAVAACVLVQGANLWTPNHDDLRDLPGLELR